MRKRSTGFIIVVLLFFLLAASAYFQLVLIKNNNYPADIDIKVSRENNTFTPYNITLAAMAGYHKTDASILDPNVILDDSSSQYEFLSLRWVEGIRASDLKAMLQDTGVLSGREQDFLNAAREYNINPVYLIAHARLETGNGSSKLANGILVEAGTYTDSHKHTYTIAVSDKYYNLFGIRAYDGGANNDGSLFAASQNWSSVGAAISGGAKWISENYINRAEALAEGKKDYDQYTLYQMRFDPYGWAVNGFGYEYATDNKWAHSIAGIIQRYEAVFNSVTLEFNIPEYV